MTNPIDLSIPVFKQKMLDVLQQLSENNEKYYSPPQIEMILNYKGHGDSTAVKTRIGNALSALHRNKEPGLVRVRNCQTTTRKVGGTYSYRYLCPLVAVV